jgi:diguanylate cyclase (GGDEF)-like protein/PAS domain S-box-containing protein
MGNYGGKLNMKETKRLLMTMIMAALFLLLGIVIWVLYFKLNYQMQNITSVHVTNTLNQLGISLAITFIFIVTLLVISSRSHSQSTELFISPHVVQRINSPETSITQLSTSIGQLLAEQKQIEEELRTREEWLSTALKSIGHAVITTDSNRKITFVNPMAEKLTGWKTKDAENKDLTDVFHTVQEENRQPGPDPFVLVQKKNTNIYQSSLITKEEKQIAIDSSVAPMKNRNGEHIGIVIVFRDVTDEKRSKDKMKFQANFDDLTGLVNRRYLSEQFPKALQRSKKEEQKLAVIFIDLDRFKSVNDSMGHEMGDFLLKQVAERLKSLIGKRDIAARIAGDEFVVILGGIYHKEITPFVDRLLNRMREPFIIRGLRLVITPSIGVSLFPDDGDTLDNLLNKADEAMYQAKNQGKNSYRFYDAAGSHRDPSQGTNQFKCD